MAVQSAWPSSISCTRFWQIRWVPEIGSTNTELLDEARGGSPEGHVVIADLQTAGRGRRGRTWTAPAGTSLMMSVLLRPPAGSLSAPQASLITSAFAVAAVDAVRASCSVSVALKWPNDLVVDVADADRVDDDQGYRKVAGILTESILSGDRVEAVVVGMGLNTGWPEVPPELRAVAQSLNLLAGHPIDRPALATSILEGFERRYASLVEARDIDGLRSAVLSRSATVGRSIRLDLGDEVVEGIAVDVDHDGRLIVETSPGERRDITVAEVVHLRPAS